MRAGAGKAGQGQGRAGRGLPGRLRCLVPIKGRSCSSGGCSFETAIKSERGRGARGMFRAVPRRVAGRGGAGGGLLRQRRGPGAAAGA